MLRRLQRPPEDRAVRAHRARRTPPTRRAAPPFQRSVAIWQSCFLLALGARLLADYRRGRRGVRRGARYSTPFDLARHRVLRADPRGHEWMRPWRRCYRQLIAESSSEDTSRRASLSGG